MQPDDVNAESIGSFQFPIPVPASDPDAGILLHCDFNAEYLPMIAGALMQLLLQSTWDTKDPNVLLLAQERADMLIQMFLEASVVYSPGMVTWYAIDTTIPAGWLICDGLAVSRTDFPDLFAVIGTLYGAGDGSTTFNIPDLRGRVPVGVGGQPGETTFIMAQTGGEENHQLGLAEMPIHNHADAGHTHAIDTFIPTAAGLEATFASLDTGLQVGSTGVGHASIGDTGGTAAHNNLQPFITLCPIIKY